MNVHRKILFERVEHFHGIVRFVFRCITANNRQVNAARQHYITRDFIVVYDITPYRTSQSRNGYVNRVIVVQKSLRRKGRVVHDDK